MKRLVFDLDGTLTLLNGGDYSTAEPNSEVIEKLKSYKNEGYEIIINTARNMRTHENNIGKINKNTTPLIIDWLNKNKVPFDELHIGKPWCGTEGFYIDDKAIRPSEFCSLSKDEIKDILNAEK